MAKTAQRDKKIFKPLHSCGGDIKMIGVAKGNSRVRLKAQCMQCGAISRKIKDIAVIMYLEKK